LFLKTLIHQIMRWISWYKENSYFKRNYAICYVSFLKSNYMFL